MLSGRIEDIQVQAIGSQISTIHENSVKTDIFSREKNFDDKFIDTRKKILQSREQMIIPELKIDKNLNLQSSFEETQKNEEKIEENIALDQIQIEIEQDHNKSKNEQEKD